jgi:amino acid adenylation domain-containing protein
MNALHLLIEEWVDRQPDACAVRDASMNRELTFRQLWQHSGHLANQLRARGVKRGDFVGIAMHRSVDMIVGVLGIIRAGAAYLALDAHAPVDRIAMMLADADVRLVVEAHACTGGPAHRWQLPEGVHRLAVPTAIGSTLSGEPDHTTVSVSGASPAYVAYTSGSTGRPKGVVVPHSAVIRLVMSPNYCTIAPGDRVANSSNPAFDAMTFEVWSTLTAGGTLVVLPTVTDLALDRWVDMIRAERITTMFLTTSLFHMVARERPTAFRTVDTLIVGGEQLEFAAVRRVLAKGPPQRLLNAYGPTETTTFATYYECTVDSLAGCERVPIGYALQNTRLRVVDGDLRPVRPGEPGELCIGGPGVALGYLHRPELTTEKFVPESPVDGHPAGTMYRTGDLVRELPSGALELLGRRDRQIKLRGFRIELEEIERAAVDTGLADAAFVEKLGQGPSATLIGFVLPAESAPTQPADLCATLFAELARRLPEYMIPARWNVLAEVPVGPTGKADRAALMAHVLKVPQQVEAAGDQDYPELAGLREIWRDVLGVAEIRDGENFIELGGNSILAIQAVFRARERFGIGLEPSDVLRAQSLADLAARARSGPRIAALAKALDAGGTDSAEDSILPAAGPAPLSFAQERLWFLHQLFPNSAEYNVPVVVRLRGQLDERSLQCALAAVVERHEILRSHVAVFEGRPALVADAPGPVSVAFHDLTDDATVAEVLAAATGAPFDLAAGPAMRADLLRLGTEDHLLALTFHHLVFDGWSVGVLIGELELRYAAYNAGSILTLPSLPIQFADFAAWQRDPARGPALAAQVAFWRDRLHGVPALQLPADLPASERRSGPGRGVPFELPEEVTEGILRLSHERGTTPFATLLGAFQVLLSRYTGQQDLAVAVPMAGRTRSETEDLIGFFVNTVVVRADLAGNPLFADVLDRTQNSLLEGLTHQEAPFERIVEELHPDRDLGRNPLAQVLFGARDPLPAFDATGLSMERYEWGQGSAGFDLAVEVEVSPDGIRGRVDFPRDLFEEGTVRRLLRHYQALLVAVAADPQARVEELPLEANEALRQVIADGTGESRPVPNRLLHELLSERAESWPDATALQWEGGQLTYAQLETWAGEIAAGLRADGAGPGTVVAVLLPRGPELVAAILGVLQSGAAYLPLDPVQPRGRLELMLADAKARFALTDQRLAPRLDDLPVQVLLIDRPAGGAVSPGNQATAGSPEQLAYVIFTSGSTGRPKPVAVSHRALVNHALAMLDLFELRASDRVLQFASPGFDVFGEELFPTLLAGARLVLPPATALPVQSVAEFETALQASAVSVVNLPCSFWAQWTKDVLSAHRQPPASLRLVVIGSEQADGRLLERWRRHSSVPVANVYGVSEATVSTTALMPAQATPLCRVPVGRPISNTQAIVLDAALRPVPSGVVGELFLGGLGVAQGYLDRPELTAERFLPNPYGPPGSRLYRTGDLARWLPSGSLDLIGRVDEQVKIRGHRVELGEIESLLAEHPCILQGAVSARTDAHGEARLVAYLVCADAPPAVSELREFLRQRLPESMLPAFFVVLERLPLSANGKLDRGALPAPEAGRLEGGRTSRAPETATERALLEIWGELLGHGSVGVDDDFFELGGHSLLATQVVSRVRERLSQELPLRSIFECPSVAALAKALDARATATCQSSAPPVLRRAARAAYRIAASKLDPLVESPQIGGTTHVA